MKARMHVMGQIGAATEVLGKMAKGETPFDANVAQASAAEIARLSGEIDALFTAEETDPKSEALPKIWVSFSDFSAKSKSLQEAATEAANGVSSPDDLPSALQGIGAACQSCHKVYRKP
ncbi:MAG: cytochrome c [Silicimonas sp.]|nr:cytochrome c [Silicimonas sp.]